MKETAFVAFAVRDMEGSLLSRDGQTEYRRCADQRAYIKREGLSEDNYVISF